MTLGRCALGFAAGTLVFSSAAKAEGTKCSQAYEKAQEERSDGHLVAALEELRVCVQSDCPSFIVDDCRRWLNQTEAELPTVVFSVLRDGVDQADAEVVCDGALLTDSLDGKAIPIDPGFHRLSVSVPGFSPVERNVLVREGERNRILEFALQSPESTATATQPLVRKPSESPPALDPSRARKYWTYGSSGVGVAGLAGFMLFAALGKSQKWDLEHSCAPYCSSSQVDGVRTKYLIGDTCLAVGIVSLAIASYLYLSGRSKGGNTSGKTSSPSIGFAPSSGGSGASMRLATEF